MNDLIRISEKDGKQICSAKELYLGLGLDKSNWSRWSKVNIEEDKFFKENEDWVRLKDDSDNQLVTNPNKVSYDYAICLEFAKHIAMMARTEKSHEYRNYFLECERKVHESVILLPNFNNPAEAARAWALEYEAKQQALLEAKEANEHVQRLTHDSKTYTTSEIAKELNLKSANQLNKILEDKGIQYKLNGTWLLYSNYADKDYVSVKQQTLDNGKIIYDRRWNGRGRDFILDLFKGC